jgi:hypothetical protein
MPFDRFAARGGPSSLRFEKVSRAERDEIERSLRRFHDVSSRRNEFETRFSRHEPNREINRESRFADERREFGDDRREFRDDRRESKTREDKREFRDDRRESRIADDRRESKFEDRRESKIGNDRRESRIGDERRDSRTADDRREGKSAEDRRLQKIGGERTESQTSRNLTTTRTPPVVSRRPVSTAGLGQQGIQESPAQRLANPKFVPQPANRGRSKPVSPPQIRSDLLRRPVPLTKERR